MKNKKKITVLILGIVFVLIVIGITYAFINVQLTGTKKQVITAGTLNLILEEDENNLNIENAFPTYDEVGMIQEPFTFRLINSTTQVTKYSIKLTNITTGEQLDTSIVKYGLEKNGEKTIDLLSILPSDGTVDSGTIGNKETIEYTLRLWIDSGVTENSVISGKSLSYRIELEAQLGTDYEITFDANDGSEVTTKIFKEGEVYGELPTPTRVGYTFDGWYTSEDELITESTIVDTLTDNTLYAKWSNNAYTLTVNPNGGTWNSTTSSSSSEMYYEETKTIDNPTRAGYTFGGWSVSGTGSSLADTIFTMGTADTTLTASWTANTNTKYVVNHYQQNAANNNYTLVSTQNLTGTTDASVSPAVNTYTGFTSPAKQTVTINGAGSTVVNYYYNRKTYTVTLKKGTGIASVSGAGTYKYGASVTINATVSSGYSWVNWSGTHSTTTQKYTFTMPNSNVTDTANGKASTLNVLSHLNVSYMESDIGSTRDNAGKTEIYNSNTFNVTDYSTLTFTYKAGNSNSADDYYARLYYNNGKSYITLVSGKSITEVSETKTVNIGNISGNAYIQLYSECVARDNTDGTDIYTNASYIRITSLTLK